MKTRVRIWTTRLLLLLVFGANVYCAGLFLLFPENYLSAYELTGAGGRAAIQGIGVAFLMWNTTYPLLIVHPDRYRALFLIVLIQQAVGIIGESCILLTLPDGYEALAESLTRFIVFDTGGLVVLLLGFFLSRIPEKSTR
ncbi:MAG: hypothetical protein LBL23_03360 [Coriobacteriales bacterium]|jgi:hypothetical protein|nr:hypothetical protein [Coriobacteriales bacterium]